MSMIVNSTFNLRELVYLKTDNEQNARIVTGLCIRDTGVQYELSCGNVSSWHYDFEMTVEKDVLKATTNCTTLITM